MRKLPGDRLTHIAELRAHLTPPSTADECVKWARNLFEDWFSTRFEHLLALNPPGATFWSAIGVDKALRVCSLDAQVLFFYPVRTQALSDPIPSLHSVDSC